MPIESDAVLTPRSTPKSCDSTHALLSLAQTREFDLKDARFAFVERGSPRLSVGTLPEYTQVDIGPRDRTEVFVEDVDR